MRRSLRPLFVSAALAWAALSPAALDLSPGPARADEGMWLLGGAPVERMQQKYGFTPSAEWLRHAQLSALRLSNGCSASFVSPGGLVMTNHHCAVGCIAEHSTAQQDLMKTGFYAPSADRERRCTGVELNQLREVEDVTAKIAAATQGKDGEAYGQAQRAAISQIEKACADATQLKCDVVNLYHGGRYDLYKYKRYKDVRLVFAPEYGMAAFGGDPDNFNFPRYGLDVTFYRAYENDRPVQTQDYLTWNDAGPQPGELVFGVGHPGTTERLLTVAQLELIRDVGLPDYLMYLAELRGRVREYQKRGPEPRRQTEELLRGVENRFKALSGQHAALDKTFFGAKGASEQALRARVAKDPQMQKLYGGAWDALAQAEDRARRLYKLHAYLEKGRGFYSDLFGIARTLLRAGDERKRPSTERLREYRDSALPTLELKTMSRRPIHAQTEELTLTFSLTKLREQLGADHPLVRKVLDVYTPEEVARNIVASTRLSDPAVRKQLWDGGAAAVQRSTDPMIRLARLIDGDARAVRKQFEDQVEAVRDKNSELIARALFAVQGTAMYPDATFTLRLTFGTVKGYSEDGREIAPLTTMRGAFERATGREPFILPPTWLLAKPRLRLDTPFNFASTLDIIGGNSGSPVLNREGHVVGLLFDGNLQSLGGAFYFDDSVNRAVAVHSSALLEALRVIYHADRVTSELQPPRTRAAAPLPR